MIFILWQDVSDGARNISIPVSYTHLVGHLYAYMLFFRHQYFIDRNNHDSVFPIILNGIRQKVEQLSLIHISLVMVSARTD